MVGAEDLHDSQRGVEIGSGRVAFDYPSHGTDVKHNEIFLNTKLNVHNLDNGFLGSQTQLRQLFILVETDVIDRSSGGTG